MGTGHHHEKEEGVDQIVNDKTTQRGEGNQHVLVDHESVRRTFKLSLIDRLDGNFHDGEGLALLRGAHSFRTVKLSFNLKHERQEIKSESP